MPKIFRLIESMGVVAMLLAWGVEPETARADDCLTQPNSSAPEGNHWYYRTDRATQRKCWYLHAPDQPAQQPAAQTASQATSSNRIPSETPTTVSGDAPVPVTPEADSPPQPHIKMLSVVSSGASDKLNQQSAKPQNINSITASTPSEESVAWPDPPTPPMATMQDSTATPTAAPKGAAPAESVQPAPAVKASARNAEDTDQPGAPTNGASQTRASVVSEPVTMALVAVLGLVVAGFLSRLMMIARRRKIIVDRSEPVLIDRRNEAALRDRQKRSGLAYQWNERIHDHVAQPDSDWRDD